MASQDDLRKAIRSMVGNMIPINTRYATVKSVSGEMCDVTLDSDLVLKNVLLGVTSAGVIEYPEVNTKVLLGFVNNSKTRAFVLFCEKVASIKIGGDSFGGIGLTEKIAARIKRCEESIEAVRNDLNAHTHVTTCAAGAGSTAPGLPTSTVIILPKTTQEYISNEHIKHGSGE